VWQRPCPVPVLAPQPAVPAAGRGPSWEVRGGGPAAPCHRGGGSQPPLSPQEAAAIIAQRPDNPRDFFKQQERVASGSSDAVSPSSHRTGEGLGGAVGTRGGMGRLEGGCGAGECGAAGAPRSSAGHSRIWGDEGTWGGGVPSAVPSIMVVRVRGTRTAGARPALLRHRHCHRTSCGPCSWGSLAGAGGRGGSSARGACPAPSWVSSAPLCRQPWRQRGRCSWAGSWASAGVAWEGNFPWGQLKGAGVSGAGVGYPSCPIACPARGLHGQGGCPWCRTPRFWVRVMPAGPWLGQWGSPCRGLAMEWGWPGRGCPSGGLGCPAVGGAALGLSLWL